MTSLKTARPPLSSPQPPARQGHFGLILMGLIGNVMEWYDFAVYGYFAGVLGKLFFPQEDPGASLIASFGAFAAGFLMRPLGGLVFGRIGDRLGRERAMSLSVLAMAVPTVLMALLPTYADIGLAAPIILVGLRIVQGLSVGGEYTSSLIYLAENAPPHRRAFTAIWGSWGAVLGMLLGSGVGLMTARLLEAPALESWGWRIPFAVGGVVATVGYLLRRHLPKDPPRHPEQMALAAVIRTHGRAMARVILINIGYGVAYYTVFVYAVTYIRSIDHLPEAVALEINTLSMLTLLLILPLAALFADVLGHLKLAKISLPLLCLLAYPLFLGIHSEDTTRILLAEIGFAVLVALTSGGMVVLNVALLPDEVRCTGLALAYNLAHGVFGGTTPLVAAWLLRETDNPLTPAMWLSGALVVSSLTLLLLVRKHHLQPFLSQTQPQRRENGD